MWWMIFSCQGSQCFCVFIFYSILKTIIQLPIWMLQFWCLLCCWHSNFKTFFKGGGNWKMYDFLAQLFLWKIGGCFFWFFGVLWEAQCFWFEMNHKFSNIHWLFMLFFLSAASVLSIVQNIDQSWLVMYFQSNVLTRMVRMV